MNSKSSATAEQIRAEFPIFQQTIYGKPLAYLDSAATTQKPRCVIECITDYFTRYNANVHRGVHYLSEQASLAFENARHTVKDFINATHSRECLFTRGTTEAVNLVAQCLAAQHIQAGDEILISALEHHSNIVPWQMICERTGALLKIIPMTVEGTLELNRLAELLTPKTKLLAITYASNALGTVLPLQQIIEAAHANHTLVFVDAAQAAAHLPIDVQALDCDFLAFSGHKTYGPTGIGVLYGKEKLLQALPPYQGGGEMILQVTHQKSIYQDIPYKFEAGTPPIAEAIALAKALEFIQDIGFDTIHQQEQALLGFTTDSLLRYPDIQIVGNHSSKIGIVSFIMEGVHPHDIATVLDQQGVAVRSGHHCAMPIMDFLKIPATVRISLGMYNTEQDIEQALAALEQVRKIFQRNSARVYTQRISSCDEAPVKASSGAYEIVCEQRAEPATKSQLERRRVYTTDHIS